MLYYIDTSSNNNMTNKTKNKISKRNKQNATKKLLEYMKTVGGGTKKKKNTRKNHEGRGGALGDFIKGVRDQYRVNQENREKRKEKKSKSKDEEEGIESFDDYIESQLKSHEITKNMIML